MILLQFSSGQGPIESCQAVGLAIKELTQQCHANNVNVDLVDAIPASQTGCFKSALLHIHSTHHELVQSIADSWQGTMLWICQSQHRPKHKRKNWYFGGRVFMVNDMIFDSEITYQTCRASGAGGQHVNTTDSAVRATHQSKGISVRVESGRSQHANKRLAKALLFHKLEAEQQSLASQQETERWRQHWTLERGNPLRVFKGEKFVAIG
ncbi:peptide chain release factor H [Vibrio ostreicida]|uniref:Peptide chain release factor H n=1 Tax=Vibrio ostreicida TaxID=526588 RepID=A0ABT8BQJ7_9VIBR|nr:peptide chain release factor H [Vibrio ostreicida]MDN3608525.1 peptide chain release factor H [Vibrio ostreicida]NPD10658.1 peptide chain release factor H [Vibrio ostreicida]